MSTPPRPGKRYADDDAEIDIGRYLFAIWRRALPIACVAIVCGVLGFVVSSTSKLTYQSTTQLVVNRSKIGDNSPQPAVNIATYRAILNNQSVAADVIKEFGLDKPPFGLTVSGFLLGVVSTELVPETNVITITARLPDPNLAARVANGFADRAVKLPETLNQEDLAAARGTIKAEVDEAARRLNDAQARLGTFRTTVQPDLVQADVVRLLNERSDLAALIMDIEAEKARLKTTEEELAKQSPTSAARSLSDVGGTLARLREDEVPARKREQTSGGTSAADRAKPQPEAQEMGVRSDALSPYANPVYEVLRQQVALSRTRLAGLERRRAAMVGGKLDGPRLARLSEMYSRQLELDRLETEYDLAKDAYTDASTRYNEARLQQSAVTVRMQRLDIAYPPDGPMPRHRGRNAIIGAGAGLVVSTLVVILLEMIVVLGASRRPQPPAAIEG